MVQGSNLKMVPYHRSQSRNLKSSSSRFGIRLTDVSAVFRYILSCLAQAVFKLWHLNPVSLILRRWRQLHHLNTRMTLRVRPRLIDLATDFFLSDDRRRRQLLTWVKSILPWLEEEVFDFTACWQDGIVLCALMESISPGACPKFNLLKAHHRVNNCRLGIQLAMRYLHVTELPLSPEEMAIAEDDSEVKICHLVQLLKWKYQKQGSKPAVFAAVSLEQPVECKCQARGTGIKAGIVGKRTKFNILTESLTHLDLLIEIRGPNKEYNKERIVSMNTGVKSRFRDQAKAAVVSASEEDGKRKIIDDGAGHSFLRQKSLDDDQGHLVIPFDYQCVGEGRFLVTYIPRTAGLHTITVMSGGVHIAGSPFEVKVSDWVSSWNLLPKSPLVPFDMLTPVEETSQDPQKPTERIMRKLSHMAHVSKQLTKMKRRILRKVITANGEAIICDVTPTLSRQNSGDLDLSGDDRRNFSRTAHTQNKPNYTHGQISDNHKYTNKSIQLTTSTATTESLKASQDDTSSSSSSPPKYHRPAGDAGDVFVATVVAARTAMTSAGEIIKNPGTDLTNKVLENTEDCLLISVNEDLKYNHLKAGRSNSPFISSETDTPQIIITQNFDTHHDGLENHLLIGQNTGNKVNKDFSNTNISDSTELDTVILTNFDEVNKCLYSKPSREIEAVREQKINKNVSIEDIQDLSYENPSSKSASPLRRVSDVVGTLLSNLKLDKRDQAVSPAHRHYMRSFSVDETHQHHVPTLNQDLAYSAGGNKSPSVSTKIIHSNAEVSIHPYSRQHTLPTHSDSTMSLDDTCGQISQESFHKSPFLEPSFSENKPSSGKVESRTEFSIPDNVAAESKRKMYLSCLHEVNTKISPQVSGDLFCENIYCAGCSHCIQEPAAIKKKDLDQRVYEIIEEISERDNDSSRHEEDISETSVDGVANDEIKFNEVILNFPEEINLSMTYKSLADVSKDIAPTRFHPYKTSLSFDISDIRPKHTIIWSQSKSFSEDRRLQKSMSYPYRTDSLVDKEWRDLAAISHSSVIAGIGGIDAEDELVSSDSEKESYNANIEPSLGDGHDRFGSSINNMFDINKLLAEQGSNERQLFSNKNWSHARMMSLIDSNDLHRGSNQNNVLNKGTRDRRDILYKTKKWNTFDAISSLQELSLPTDLDQLSQKQNSMPHEDFDTEDDEILQIIIDENVTPLSTENSLGNNKTMLIPRSYDGPDMGVYTSNSDDLISIPHHDSTFEVNINERTQCAETSPLSVVSNKSGNSDWSDNENSPTRAYQRSTRRRSSSKGDWSPQLVDLLYGGSLAPKEKSTTHKENGPCVNSASGDSNSSRPFYTQTSKTNPTKNKQLLNSFHRNESTITSSGLFGGRKTQGTQYEFPLSPVSDAEISNAQLVPEYPTQALMKNCKQPTRMLSGKSTLSYSSPGVGPRNAVINFPRGSDEHTVYIKRRRKPVYTPDKLTGNYHANPHQADANYRKAAVNTIHHVHNNINYKPQIPSQDEDNSFFATLRLFSPDLANYLSLDHSVSSNSNGSDGCVYDNTVHCESEHQDFSCSSTEKVPSQMNYFRERTLTPTKYRKRKQRSRPKVKSRQRISGRANLASPENRNTEYPLFSPEDMEDWTDTEKESVTLKLVTQPGSAQVSLGSGDRTLTPTKYRRRVYYNDGKRYNFSVVNSKQHKLKRQTQKDQLYSEGSSDNETMSSTKQPETSAIGASEYFQNHGRIKSNTFVLNKGGVYHVGKNSFAPISRDEVGTTQGCMKENRIDPSRGSNNFQTQINSSNHSAVNIRPGSSPPSKITHSTPVSSRNQILDENGRQLYIRKRHKKVLVQAGGKSNSSDNNYDNNKSINLFDYQLSDDECYDEDTQNMLSSYTDKSPKQRSQLQQNPFHLNYQNESPTASRHQHQTTAADSHGYTHDNYHSSGGFHKRYIPDHSPSRSPHFTQRHQKPPIQRKPLHLLMDDQVYNSINHQQPLRQDLEDSSFSDSFYHSHQRSIYQPRGQRVQQQCDSYRDESVTIRQRRQPYQLRPQPRQDQEYSQDQQDISRQNNLPPYRIHQHQEDLQQEEQLLHGQTPQHRHSHQVQQIDEGRGNGEMALVRQSTVDTPDSGITDDSVHYSVPLT